MNRRTRSIAVLAAWIALFFLLGLGVWSFQGGELMLIVYLIGSAIIYVLCAFLIRCPHCRMPLLLVPIRLLGMELFRWSILLPDRCRHCGEQVG